METISALEQEIIDKFRLLDYKAQKRLLNRLRGYRNSKAEFDAWIGQVKALQAKMRADGDATKIGVVELLREIRNGEDENG